MKAKQPQDEEMRMDAGEFDRMMRRALQAHPPANEVKTKRPAKKRSSKKV
jgi:hypothetical protein